MPVQTGSETVEVHFIVVDAYSPYTTIVARPWLHTLGVVSSTLHQKIKYPSEGQIEEILGVHGCSHPTQARSRICDSRRGAIVVKTPNVTYWWDIR